MIRSKKENIGTVTDDVKSNTEYYELNDDRFRKILIDLDDLYSTVKTINTNLKQKISMLTGNINQLDSADDRVNSDLPWLQLISNKEEDIQIICNNILELISLI